MRLSSALLFLTLSTSAAACASTSQAPKTLTYTEDARRAYEEAMTAFRAKDWEGSRPLFQEVKKNFPQSRYARLAELRLADIDFAQEKYTDAIGAYRAFAQTYRTDKEAEYARYRLSKALFFDISDTILQPPAEERDQAVTADAHRELKAFLRAFPRTRWRKDVEYMLEVVTGRLVRHELYVARYYRRQDNFDATIARIDYALKTYPNSGLDPEALVLKGETLMMMNRKKEAKVVFESVIKDWGGPFAITAREFLEELKAPSQDPPDIRRPADPGVPEKKKEDPAKAKTPAPKAPPPAGPGAE
jgi:outer membrane protein assembly factor BamD